MNKLCAVLMSSLFLAPVATGCGSKQAKPKTATQSQQRAQPAAVAKRTPSSTTGVRSDGSMQKFSPIYFDFDADTLRPESRQTLADIGQAMQNDPSMRVLIEGHADERGTDEYNVALGDRRANAIREYLLRLGIAPNRLATISYGEERPAAFGQGEDAWAKNRRGEFVQRR